MHTIVKYASKILCPKKDLTSIFAKRECTPATIAENPLLREITLIDTSGLFIKEKDACLAKYWVSQKKLLHKSEGKNVPKKEDDLAEI